jgi:hypothetical protein
MNADNAQRPGIAVLATAKPLNSVVLAFTSSISPAFQRVLTAPEHSWPRPGEHEQVIGEHAQSHPPLHPPGASVAASSQYVPAFQGADPPVAARAPAQSGTRRARARLPRLTRQDDVPDPTVLRRALMASRREAATGDRQVGACLNNAMCRSRLGAHSERSKCLRSGGGRGIRTPKGLAARWISSSNRPSPHHVVIGRQRYLSCLCEARSRGSKYSADR